MIRVIRRQLKDTKQGDDFALLPKALYIRKSEKKEKKITKHGEILSESILGHTFGQIP